jgi:hypothetical protein
MTIPAPQQWRRESPTRRDRTTEADKHESAVARFSTLLSHAHDYQVTVVNLVPQPSRCTLCGHPLDCVVCR